MAVERELRKYVPGDMVHMELTIEHDAMNLENAFARFINESNPQFHLVLCKEFLGITREETDGHTQSRVSVEAAVPAGLPTGEYVLEQIHIRCSSGRIYQFTENMLPNPRTRFVGAEEPTHTMRLRDTILMD